MSRACPGQPSSKGLAGRRPGHNLLTKESRAPFAQTSWLHLGQGIRKLGTAPGFLSANQLWLEAGIKAGAEECGSFPPRSPSWHRIPHSRLGLHNAAYESKISTAMPACGQARMGGKKGKERGFLAEMKPRCPPCTATPTLCHQGREGREQ